MSEMLGQTFATFVDRGVLSPLDVEVAQTLGRLASESSESVLLAAALASRAPRFGHICADIARAEATIRHDRRGAASVGDWPETQQWLDELSSSPLVRKGLDDGDTPLVLEGSRLYLDRYYQYEARLLSELSARCRQSDQPFDQNTARSSLDRLFPPQGEDLDRQKLAAAVALLNLLTVISGGPGTGKTTTVKKILAVLLELEPTLRIAMAAPTGKAAARLTESLKEGLHSLETEDQVKNELAGLEASTIHRLLQTFGRGSGYRFSRKNPLPFDVVIVDEASMVDFALMTRLVEAVKPTARLVLLGDRDQLASVEAGAVFGDICGPDPSREMLSAPFAQACKQLVGQSLDQIGRIVPEPGIWDSVVHLNRFYRFGADSGIGQTARAINAGDEQGQQKALTYLRGQGKAQGSGRYEDVELLEIDDSYRLPPEILSRLAAPYVDVISSALSGEKPDHLLELLSRCRVLTAHRRGPFGAEGLGAAIERELTRQVPAFSTDQRWYIGRPVMIRRNDYTLRLFNGDIGIVVRAGKADPRPQVAFQSSTGEARTISPARLPEHQTVFAMTVHKAQGSQLNHAMVVLPNKISPVLTRELIYTAMTRATEKVTLIGTEEVLTSAISTRVQRASGLPEKLYQADRAVVS